MSVSIQYFKSLQNVESQDMTETSLRSPLQDLFNALAMKDIKVLHEGKRHGKFGTPDFKISNLAGTIGFCETKKVGENLKEILKSDQIEKSQKSCLKRQLFN